MFTEVAYEIKATLVVDGEMLKYLTKLMIKFLAYLKLFFPMLPDRSNTNNKSIFFIAKKNKKINSRIIVVVTIFMVHFHSPSSLLIVIIIAEVVNHRSSLVCSSAKSVRPRSLLSLPSLSSPPSHYSPSLSLTSFLLPLSA